MASDLALYRIFGLMVASDHPFVTRLLPAGEVGAGEKVIRFSRSMEPPAGVELGDLGQEGQPPIYCSPDHTAEGKTVFSLYRHRDLLLLSFTDLPRYYLGPDWIHCQTSGPEQIPQAEILLFGPVLSFWLERQGLAALHAAAVVIDGRAIGIMGQNGVGKSSLTTELLRSGAALLDDDVLPVERMGEVFLARSGYPQMRMWPDLATRVFGRTDGLPRILPGVDKRRVAIDGVWPFCERPMPLAALYQLERADVGQGSSVGPVSTRDALIELVRHSFVPRLVSALGLEPARLDLLARLAQAVPVRRLSMAQGVEHLPGAARAVLADFADVAPAA